MGCINKLTSKPNPGYLLTPALSGYNYYYTYYYYNTHTSTIIMYRQAMLARTALRASRTRGFATAAETAPEDFASARKAVKAHAVGMSPPRVREQANGIRDY
jgi:hypothetical protein